MTSSREIKEKKARAPSFPSPRYVKETKGRTVFFSFAFGMSKWSAAVGPAVAETGIAYQAPKTHLKDQMVLFGDKDIRRGLQRQTKRYLI